MRERKGEGNGLGDWGGGMEDSGWKGGRERASLREAMSRAVEGEWAGLRAMRKIVGK